jgi:asparagine synthase (glutamine-hydrolysing)
VAPREGWPLDAAVEQAEALLTRSVERQLESDVPLGALLSGGIDSSLVSAAAQRATGQLRTFNVQFPEGYDETWAAVSVARHIGSTHRTLRMDEGEATWDRVTSLLTHAGQPFADSSLFAVHAVSRLMRQHVTVVLSGDGGDEGFGGYDVSWQIARYARLQRVPALAWTLACAGGSRSDSRTCRGPTMRASCGTWSARSVNGSRWTPSTEATCSRRDVTSSRPGPTCSARGPRAWNGSRA